MNGFSRENVGKKFFCNKTTLNGPNYSVSIHFKACQIREKVVLIAKKNVRFSQNRRRRIKKHWSFSFFGCQMQKSICEYLYSLSNGSDKTVWCVLTIIT